MGGGRTFHEPQYRAGFIQEKSSSANKINKDVDISDLPKQLDWRNKDGQNYVGPVVNQGSCGSCYAVAVTDMLRSRIQIKTKNRVKPELSAQETLSCNQYGQGCKGGFPFLVGKYAQDFGVVKYSDKPYVGREGVSC